MNNTSLEVYASQEYTKRLINGLKIGSLELVSVESCEFGTLYNWHCNDCGKDYVLNEESSVGIIKDCKECSNCLHLRGVYTSVSDLYVGCSLSNFIITGISESEVTALCLFCNEEESHHISFFDNLIQYRLKFNKVLLVSCNNCLGKSANLVHAEESTTALANIIQNKREQYMVEKGDIIQYKFNQNSNGNTRDTVYLDASSRKLANYSLTTTSTGTFLISLGRNKTVELGRFMFGNQDRKIAIMHRNKIDADFRRGNLVPCIMQSMRMYKPLRGTFFEDGVFKVKTKGVTTEFDNEYDALKFFRQFEEDTYNQLAYNPIFDLSLFSEAMEMIFNGTSDTEIHRRMLVYLAHNPWICVRYNLEPLLSNFGIVMESYTLNEQGFICDSFGTPLFCTVKDWGIFR